MNEDASTDSEASAGPTEVEVDPTADLLRRADVIRTEMGGPGKVERLHDRGEATIRDHIDALLDPDSFEELGTFSRSLRPEDRTSTPGDGKVGGNGTIDGQPVTVFGDDITVRRGSSSVVGSRKLMRLEERAIDMGMPIVHFGQTGGGRIPDLIGAEGISDAGHMFSVSARRRRQVPMATAIVGQSFGGSSFHAALSDFVVMTRGSTLAVTSPRVFEVATGEIVTFEEVGGVDVHATKTGQIDLGVETNEEAYEAVRRWLSYLPPNAWTPAPRAEPTGSLEPDQGIPDIVPERRTRGYDMRRLVARICDPDTMFELQPGYARQTTAALGRIDGWSVGIVANNPMFQAGVLDPDAARKITRLVCLCDAFNLPIIFLVDVPGFMVGKKVEHERILHVGMRMMQALQNTVSPTLTVAIRKAFGLAWPAMNGANMPSMGLYAWPGAEIGFMDPEVGVNVAFGARLAAIEDPDKREAERLRMVAEVGEATSPYEAAGTMRLDEIIEPATTRAVLARELGRLAGRRVPPPEQRPLAGWPTS